MLIEPKTRISRIVINTLIYFFLGLWSLIVIFPMLWVLVSSFKTSQEIFFSPWLPPAKLMCCRIIDIAVEYHKEQQGTET